MPKANIKTKDGAIITIEGSEEEVIRIINKLSVKKTEKLKKIKAKGKIKPTTKITMSDLVNELKEEGFFDEPRSLVKIKNAFAEKGYVYSVEAISTPMLRLVKKRVIGRIKKDRKWMYVKR